MRNFRELAYQNMKKGMLFRSDVLYRTTAKEKELLKKQCGVKTIIDLRNGEEIAKLKDSKIPGIKYYNIPLLPESEDGKRKESRTVEIKGVVLADLPYYYRGIVNINRKKDWGKIFDILLNNKEGGILFHCSAGRDRTGVVAAIILSALGIDKETIYNDYLETNKNPLYYKRLAAKMEPVAREVYLDYYEAKKAYLDETFGAINEQYGSIDNFLFECCSLNKEKIEQLKNKYVNK